MDSNTPKDDNLIEFERRLSGWCPSSDNSKPDTVLFAAGFAAGRGFRSRRLWPSIVTLFIIQASGLLIWALSEREQRRNLESQLHETPPSPPREIAPPDLPEPTYEPSPQDYFHLLRAAEQDPISWLAPPRPGPLPPVTPLEKPSLRRTIQLDGLLDL
jgi:hypothetical protein